MATLTHHKTAAQHYRTVTAFDAGSLVGVGYGANGSVSLTVYGNDDRTYRLELSATEAATVLRSMTARANSAI